MRIFAYESIRLMQNSGCIYTETDKFSFRIVGFKKPQNPMVRTLFIIVWTIMVTMFWGSITILASFLSKTSVILHKIARLWGQSILLACGIKVAAKGLSNLHPEESYIYMPKKQIRIQPQDVVLEFAAPVQTRAYNTNTMDDLMEQVHNIIRKSFEKSYQGRSLC